MRLKFLLFAFLLWGGFVSAQDTINYLVITEYRGDNTNHCYLELTNMGDVPVELNQFKIGHWGGNDKLDYVTGKVTDTSPGYWIPGDIVLQPGEAFVFAAVKEFGPRMFAKGLENFPERVNHPKTWEYADFLVHLPEEMGDETDIVTENFYQPFNEQWGPGMNGFFIEQHFPNGDSMVVDQVGGMFTGVDGANLDRVSGSGYDVAGVPQATGNSVLVRRFNVKKGNLNFAEARGVGLDDSEWIPIPMHGGEWRSPMWTMGNHGDYNLDENTLISDVIDVDFANKTLTVPWGVRRGDDIMNYFEKKPGVGWEYILAPDADSLTWAAQTGDQLLIYVCGNDLDFQAFDIVVQDPAANANMVVPVTNEDPIGNWRGTISNGYLDYPRVTQHESGNDTIWGSRGGIPYSTRVDTLLLDRLEKPSNAEWEIVYASGVAKPDLSDGDLLRVTAQDGSVKDYYISVNEYRASTDARLAAITWPDIPPFYKGLFGWNGDTIPGFSPLVLSYNVEVPLMAEGTPALVTKSADLNAKVEVDRAKSLAGSVQDRTVTFSVTAEDDTTLSNYSVVLTKAKNPENLQPNLAEPFISEVCFNMGWQGNDFLEIANPGNQPLDLSDYMLLGDNIVNPAEAIAQTNETDWMMRYEKYIPGYKWAANEAEWVVDPYLAQLDLSVSAIVQPGEVFTLGAVKNEMNYACGVWPVPSVLDVQFLNGNSACGNAWTNQWGEEIAENGTPMTKFFSQTIYLFKILNDSIKLGLKPATDPDDFKLIDVIGMGDGTNWTMAGASLNNPFSIVRKPEISSGNPVIGKSLGVNSPDDVEWDLYNIPYWNSRGNGWPARMILIAQDLGKHFFINPTNYMSTVSSLVYKVSEGYQSEPPHEPQTIRGITTGTTVAGFLDNIIKADEGQSLTLTSANDGSMLAVDALLSLNDTLTVLSADSTNTTKYVLEVSEDGLSSDAVLTSTRYEITIDAEPKSAGDEHTPGSGSITGFEYGTTLQTVINNVTEPAGATMTVISGEGAYVPLKRLNYDTTFVTVTVNDNTFFEVIAENGVTTITYQLLPSASASSAFVLSDVYSVSQSNMLIEFVPRGTNAQSFISNLVPSAGSTMKLVDKWGFERTDGGVADDDRLIVTSADGTVSVTYHIGKQATEYIPANTYLAYILSNVYGIDQVEYQIHGASGIADISEFYSRIRTAPGATAVVIDENGSEKISGTLSGSDMVKVTSADGKIEVMYTFGQLTSSDFFEASQIEFYPNPTNGILNVLGVEKGQRIQVYNTVGTAVLDIEVNSNRGVIPLQNEPAGMYLIVVSKENRLVGRYKAIKK
jgi:hypothetical protein